MEPSSAPPPALRSRSAHEPAMSARTTIIAAAALLAALAPFAGAQGRPLRVDMRQTLTFGNVLPGVPNAVRPTDAAASAQFDISGAKGSQVELTFTLPTSMSGPGGVAIPLVFGPASAGISATGSAADQVAADPRGRLYLTLSHNGRAFVNLGGTLLPGAQQRAGAYTAPIILTAAYTGL